MVIRNEKVVLHKLLGLYTEDESKSVIADLVGFVRWHLRNAASHKEAGRSGRVTPHILTHHLQYMVADCWNALDGLGRVINCALLPRYPQANLVAPAGINAQCTFYTVRRDLHRDPDAKNDPVSQLMWEQTRAGARPAYRRLSLYYHISRFVILPVSDNNTLPGWESLPEHMKQLARSQDVESVGGEEGMSQIIRWEQMFIEQCYERISRGMDVLQ